MVLAWTMDKIGPMARTAEDCGLILEAIAGPDPRDPSSAPERFRLKPRPRGGQPLRLGVLSRDFEKHRAPEAEKAFDAALQVFRSLGHRVKEARLPDFPWFLIAKTLIDVGASAAFENLIRG